MSLDVLKANRITGQVNIEPTETLFDPVSKFRVSNPENLIDTDFEYGLQSTKWETLELINNIPTFFARDGKPSLQISSLTGEENSNVITVTTSIDHGLIVGTVIIVKGASLAFADGTYVVQTVVSPTQFTYLAKRTAPNTSSFLETTTEIYTASLYQGTEFKLENLGAIVTDAEATSTITVSTKSPHGFKARTNFILLNSLTSQEVRFNARLVEPVGYVENQPVIRPEQVVVSDNGGYPDVGYPMWGSNPSVGDVGSAGMNTVVITGEEDEGTFIVPFSPDYPFKIFDTPYTKLWVNANSSVVFTNSEDDPPTGGAFGLETPRIDIFGTQDDVDGDWELMNLYYLQNAQSLRLRWEGKESGSAEVNPTFIWEMDFDAFSDEVTVKLITIPASFGYDTFAVYGPNNEAFDLTFTSADFTDPKNRWNRELTFYASTSNEDTNAVETYPANQVNLSNASRINPFEYEPYTPNYNPFQGESTIRTTTYFSLGKQLYDKWNNAGLQGGNYIEKIRNGVIYFKNNHELSDNQEYVYYAPQTNGQAVGLRIAGTHRTNGYYAVGVRTASPGTTGLSIGNGIYTGYSVNISATAAGTNRITTAANGTNNLWIGQPVVLFPTGLGNMVAGTVYYVKEVISTTLFTVSDTIDGNGVPGDVFVQSSASGTRAMYYGGIITDPLKQCVFVNPVSSETAAISVDFGVPPSNERFPVARDSIYPHVLAVTEPMMIATGVSGNRFMIARKGPRNAIPENQPLIFPYSVYTGTAINTVPFETTDIYYARNVNADNYCNTSTVQILSHKRTYQLTGCTVSAIAINSSTLTFSVPYANILNSDATLVFPNTAVTTAGSGGSGTTGDSITIANHGLLNGDPVTYGFVGGTTIGGLAGNTIYYVIYVDDNTIRLATTSANASNRVAINLTSTGTSTSHRLTTMQAGTFGYSVEIIGNNTLINGGAAYGVTTTQTGTTTRSFTVYLSDKVPAAIAAQSNVTINLIGINNENYDLLTFGVSTVPNGTPINITAAVSETVWALPITYPLQTARSFYFKNHNLQNGDIVRFDSTNTIPPSGFTNAASYRAETLSQDRFRLLSTTGAQISVSSLTQTIDDYEDVDPIDDDTGTTLDTQTWIHELRATLTTAGTSVAITAPQPAVKNANNLVIPALSAAQDTFTVTSSTRFVGGAVNTTSGYVNGARIKFYDANGNDILLSDNSSINDLDIRAGVITGTSNISMTCFVLTPGGLPGTFAGLNTARAIVDPGFAVRTENITSSGTTWADDKWSVAQGNSVPRAINAIFRDRYEISPFADSTLKTARISAYTTVDPAVITYTYTAANTVNINTIERSSNIVTLETTVPHGFKIGQDITVAGVSNATFNGTFSIIRTSLYKIVYAQNAVDATSASGTVYQRSNALAMRVPTTISNITQANPAVITTTAAHNIATGQPFHFQGITGGDWGGLWNHKVYYAKVLTSTTFEVWENKALSSGLDTTGFSTSYVQGTNGGRNWYLGMKLDTASPLFNFTSRSSTGIGDTLFIPNHGLQAGTPVTYTTGGGTAIDGLVAGSTKYVFTPSQDRLRLTDTAAGWSTPARTFTQNTTSINVTTGVITTGTHGFTTGNQVQYLSATAPSGLSNGAFYYVRADSATTCTLYWTKNGALNNIASDRVTAFAPITGSGSLRQATVVDILADGDGENHALTTPTEVGTLDGLYELADPAPGGDTTKFTLANPSNATVPKRVISINSDISVDLFNDAFYTATHGLVTGTPVLYRVGSGATSIGTLIDQTEYYAIKVSNDWFRLALSQEDALSNNFVTVKAGNYKGSGVHELETASIVGAVPAAGTLTLSAGSNIILGSGTNFTANYRAGDTFYWAFPPITAGIAKTTTFSGSTFTSSAHRMMTGLSVRWNSTGTEPTNLVNEYIYYVRYLSANTFQLHPTYDDAINNTNAISTSGGVGTHTVSVITVGSVGDSPIEYVASTTKLTIKEIPDLDEWQKLPVTSVATTAVAQSVVTVTLPVNHSFAVGSVVNLRGTGVTELDTEDWVISSVTATTVVFSALSNLGALTLTNSNTVGIYIYGFSTATYDVTSSLLIRADSASLHRPYDGGVEIVASNSPQAKMIRQTKKYFRYQSGKGIQVSFAINFSPTVQINKITGLGDGTARVTTRLPHRLTDNVNITIVGDTSNVYNGEFVVSSVVDDYAFLITIASTSAVSTGRPEFYVNSWSDATLRCGLFDDQNGMFFEFDGATLYAVRRNSTKQIGGSSAVQFGSNIIVGTDTSFSSELNIDDFVVIKGQSYKVVEITNNSLMYIQPSYRGVDSNNVVISKTEDLRFSQSQWNLDICDGTGPTGYNLDIHKIQMAYMDYSWYGAGKIRFGFKDQDGTVRYVHQIAHNNLETEAYMRSGNLPARYEVFTGDNPSFIPNLAHWGTSVIMDGGFSEDKSYLFSATSNPIYTTSATPQNVAVSTVRTSDIDLNPAADQQGSEIMFAYDGAGNLIGPIGYALQINTHSDLYYSITSNNLITNVSGVSVRTGTRTSTPIDARIGSSPYLRDVTVGFNNKNPVKRNLLVIDKPPANEQQTNSSVSVAGNFDFTQYIPLISIRLAPSVDNGVAGGLGVREIINRMQLTLQSLDVLSTHECEMQLVINPDLDNFSWRTVNSPSLSEVIYHSLSDTVTNGSVVFTFQTPAGSQQVIAAGASQRELVLTTVDLSNVATLGNSILGGDSVFPDGPDVLTLRFRYLGLTGLVGGGTTGTAASPFRLNARISWAESQA